MTREYKYSMQYAVLKLKKEDGWLNRDEDIVNCYVLKPLVTKMGCIRRNYVKESL